LTAFVPSARVNVQDNGSVHVHVHVHVHVQVNVNDNDSVSDSRPAILGPDF